MNAKEKANELFNKYFSEIRMPSDCEGCMQCVDRCGNMVAVAKKYALIAVQNAVENIEVIDAKMINDNFKEALLLYWEAVKSELQSL